MKVAEWNKKIFDMNMNEYVKLRMNEKMGLCGDYVQGICYL